MLRHALQNRRQLGIGLILGTLAEVITDLFGEDSWLFYRSGLRWPCLDAKLQLAYAAGPVFVDGGEPLLTLQTGTGAPGSGVGGDH